MKFCLKLCALLAIFSATSIFAQGKFAGCSPSFSASSEWQGSDDAYSIPLKDGRMVWIFGDTLYGPERSVRGEDPRMTRNSIGVSTCTNGRWKIDYVLRKDKAGKYLDYFEPQHLKTWYWPMDGIEVNDALWVTLLCVRDAPKGNNFGFGFEICGSDIARISKLSLPPSQWKVTYQPLTAEASHSNPTSSVIRDGEFVYFYTKDDKHNVMHLTRVRATEMGRTAEMLEYLATDGAWRKNYDPEKAKAVMDPGTSEMSVRYHLELKRWVAVMVDPNPYVGDVWIRFASSLSGPWSKPQTIYKIPELNKTAKGYDKDVFCYAGKEHPAYEKKGELLFTYVCNVAAPKKLESMHNIYFPQVVRMPMPTEK